jgi:hypothetical protein
MGHSKADLNHHRSRSYVLYKACKKFVCCLCAEQHHHAFKLSQGGGGKMKDHSFVGERERERRPLETSGSYSLTTNQGNLVQGNISSSWHLRVIIYAGIHAVIIISCLSYQL